jgi:hypothetical protein
MTMRDALVASLLALRGTWFALTLSIFGAEAVAAKPWFSQLRFTVFCTMRLLASLDE